MIFSSCKKEEGEGGTSTITGKVIVHNFDPGYQNPAPTDIYPAADQKVFIIYGEGNTRHNDDYDTSFDGTFEFKYLQKGTYKLFVYSKDSTGAKTTGQTPNIDKAIFLDVEINENGSTITTPDIIILDNEG
jgi:hypothetical protein